MRARPRVDRPGATGRCRGLGLILVGDLEPPQHYGKSPFEVDWPVAERSWRRGAIQVSSLSDYWDGWRREHINDVTSESEPQSFTGSSSTSTAAPLTTVRLLIRGTGRCVLFGHDLARASPASRGDRPARSTKATTPR